MSITEKDRAKKMSDVEFFDDRPRTVKISEILEAVARRRATLFYGPPRVRGPIIPEPVEYFEYEDWMAEDIDESTEQEEETRKTRRLINMKMELEAKDYAVPRVAQFFLLDAEQLRSR